MLAQRVKEMEEEIEEIRAHEGTTTSSWDVMSAASAPSPPTPWQAPASPCGIHALAPTLDEDSFLKIQEKNEDVHQFCSFLSSSHIDDVHNTLWKFWWKPRPDVPPASRYLFSHDVRKNRGNAVTRSHMGWCCKKCRQGYFEDLYTSPEKRDQPAFQKEVFDRFRWFFRMADFREAAQQSSASALEVGAEELARSELPLPTRVPPQLPPGSMGDFDDEEVVAVEPLAIQK